MSIFNIRRNFIIRQTYYKKYNEGDTIIKKTLIASVLVLVLTACMFSGCLGDKIVGTWTSDSSSSTTVTFNKDGTYAAKAGIIEIKGDWIKEDGNYTLYYQDVKVGSASFDSSKSLRITLGSGLLSISGTFTKA